MDLDGDGRSDILSGSWPGEIYFFRRLTDGSFAEGRAGIRRATSVGVGPDHRVTAEYGPTWITEEF